MKLVRPQKHSMNEMAMRYKWLLTNLAEDFSSLIARLIFLRLQQNSTNMKTPMTTNVTAMTFYRDCWLNDYPKYSVNWEACNDSAYIYKANRKSKATMSTSSTYTDTHAVYLIMTMRRRVEMIETAIELMIIDKWLPISTIFSSYRSTFNSDSNIC